MGETRENNFVKDNISFTSTSRKKLVTMILWDKNNERMG